MMRNLRNLWLVLLLSPIAAPAAPSAAENPRTAFTPSSYHSGLKDGFGTAADTRSRAWFTLTHGAVSEVFAPRIDHPMLRGIEFAVVTPLAAGGFDLEREHRDFTPDVRLADPLTLAWDVTSRSARHDHRIEKRVFTDPAGSVLVVRGRFVRGRTSISGPPRLYLLADPMFGGKGDDDRGEIRDGAFVGAETMFIGAETGGHVAAAMVLVCDPPLGTPTAGLHGIDDGYAQLSAHGALISAADRAGPGNVVFAGEIALADGEGSFTVLVGFGSDEREARAAVEGTRARGVDAAERDYLEGWRRVSNAIAPPPDPADTLYRASALILYACEDKENPGAFIASPTMPWGDVGGPWGDLRGDASDQHYFKVWSRDLFHTTTALLAAGDPGPALRALDFLDDRAQREDGSFPQTCDVTGRTIWPSVQMDQVAAPILLAHRLLSVGAIGPADRWESLVRPAADYIADHGPWTRQERWENLDGYSPATIASQIAALVAAADFARRAGDAMRATRYGLLATTWDREIERWTFTGKPTRFDADGHYVKISRTGTPNELDFNRDDLDVSVLELVRLGVRRADDPLVERTVAVLDRVLARDLPTGRHWMRFAEDGYGENGQGRPWPLLAGERGHYEIARGRGAADQIAAMRASARGVILSEQIWDVGPEAGRPTGASAPLAWAHGEYLKLVLSEASGRVVDLPEIMERRSAGLAPTRSHVVAFASENATEMVAFRVYGGAAASGASGAAGANVLEVSVDDRPARFRLTEGWLELVAPVTGVDSMVRIAEAGRVLYRDRPLLAAAARRARLEVQWISIAGAFNNWNPADRTHELRPSPDGGLALELALPAGRFEYKFAVNGSWETNYGGRDGRLQRNGPNFVLDVPAPGTYRFHVAIDRLVHEVMPRP